MPSSSCSRYSITIGCDMDYDGLCCIRLERIYHRNNTQALGDFVADATCYPFAINTSEAQLHPSSVYFIANPILRELTRVSKEWHSFCPYDWSASVTEFGQWLGGHSSFSPWQGNPESVIRYLLSDNSTDPLLRNAEIVREKSSLPWNVRVHSRSKTNYDVHYVHTVVNPKVEKTTAISAPR